MAGIPPVKRIRSNSENNSEPKILEKLDNPTQPMIKSRRRVGMAVDTLIGYLTVTYESIRVRVCGRAGVCGRIFAIFEINLTFFDICGICRILGLFRKCLTFLVFVLSPAFLEYLRSLWHSCKAPKGLYLKVLWHSWRYAPS